MKTLITSMALAVTLTAMATSEADAQLVLKRSKQATDIMTAPPPKVDPSTGLKTSSKDKDQVLLPSAEAKTEPFLRPFPKGKDVMTAPSATSTLKRPLKNKRVLTGGLGIGPLLAERFGNKILITAIVNNTSSIPTQFDFQFGTRVGNAWWKPVPKEAGGSGTKNIGGKESFRLTAEIPNTNEAGQISLEINGGPNNELSAKETPFKARRLEYVVKYGTNGEWIEARNYPDDLSNGFDASEFARTALQPLGLDTHIKTTKRTSVDEFLNVTTRYNSTLYVRTNGHITREFSTRKDAEKFRKLVISRVPDRRLTVESVHEQEL